MPTLNAEGHSKEVYNNGTFAVQVDSTVPGTSATSLGKAEDAAHASGDVGVMMLAVRTDTAANRSGTDGDYEPLQISGGNLHTSATPVASETHLGEVGGKIVNASANFTRPADTTAYAANDLVANSVTAGSVVPLSFTATRIATGSGKIRRAKLKKSGTTVTAASFRLHLYASSPTIANGDNATWSTTHSGYLGSFSLDMSGAAGRVFSDSAAVIAAPDHGAEIDFKLASGSTIFGLLAAVGAYTPASAEVFTAELEIEQN